jgi:hypothetical protein
VIFDRQADKMRHSLQQFEIVINGMVLAILGAEMGYLRPGNRQNLHGAGKALRDRWDNCGAIRKMGKSSGRWE